MPTDPARMAMNWQQELLAQTIAAAQPAAKKVKVVPVAAEPATAAAAPAEKENAPDGCKQQ